MVQLVAWVALSAGVAWVLRARPLVTVGLAVVLWTLVPAVAAQRLTGVGDGPLAVHPATWLLLATAGLAVLIHPRVMLEGLGQHPLAVVALSLFVAVAVVTSVLLDASGLKMLLDMVLAPVLLFWVVTTFARHDPPGVWGLRRVVIGAVSLQCLLAIVERVQGRLLFYRSDYSSLSWFDEDRFERWMGTTDNHLVLAFAIAVAAPLTVQLRSPSIRVALLALQLMAAVITQSRVIIAILAVVLVYLFVRGRMSPLARIGTMTVVAVGVVALLGSDLTAGIRSRISDDGGSAQARGYALEFFYSQVPDYWLTGDGLMSSYDVASTGGLETSFESSFVMYAVDVGILAALAYFGTMLALVLRYGPGNRIAGAPLSALLGLGMAQTFSGLGYSNLSGVLLWTALALVVAGSPLTAGPSTPTGQPSSRPGSADRRRMLATSRGR